LRLTRRRRVAETALLTTPRDESALQSLAKPIGLVLAPRLQSTGSMRIKIYDGTPGLSGESLCATCRHSTITRGRRFDEEIVRCEAQSSGTLLITFPVTQCTGYFDTRRPSYSELMRQAWILRPRSGKRPAGFVRASELSFAEQQEVMMEGPDDPV
jgi:hypothetical protein